MQKSFFSTKFLVAIAIGVTSMSACSVFEKKGEKSSMTGMEYGNASQGGFKPKKVIAPKIGPGLVFIEGGEFQMGSRVENVMGDHDNPQMRKTINSFFMDETEVANVHYREYVYWAQHTFSDDSAALKTIMNKILPDSLVWRDELAYNEPLVETYFRYPAYNYYPVVGVSWQQAVDFCTWRTDRVNEIELVKKGYLKKDAIKKEINGGGRDKAFNTTTYRVAPDSISEIIANPNKNKGNKSLPKPNPYATIEDGQLQMDYRLPTEAEWEFAAYGGIEQTFTTATSKKKKNKKAQEEIQGGQRIYSWNKNKYDGLRDDRHGSFQGRMLANFKRGKGDYMGTAGAHNDNAALTSPIKSFYPNAYGLYNMCGNVNEWVLDLYRPNTLDDAEDMNPYRGNKFERLTYDGLYKRDSMGWIQKQKDTLELKFRVNYQTNDARDYADGDSISGVFYDYGKTTLINNQSRVYKGGSWKDMAYWLTPGARRFLQEDMASNQIGFRCARNYAGPSKGPGTKDGNWFSKKRQNNRK